LKNFLKSLKETSKFGIFYWRCCRL